MTEPTASSFSTLVYSTPDYRGVGFSVSMFYDETTRMIYDVLIHREPGCVYDAITVGPPGNPLMTFSAPEGDTQVSPATLAGLGIHTIDDFISAGDQLSAITSGG